MRHTFRSRLTRIIVLNCWAPWGRDVPSEISAQAEGAPAPVVPAIREAPEAAVKKKFLLLLSTADSSVTVLLAWLNAVNPETPLGLPINIIASATDRVEWWRVIVVVVSVVAS